MSTQFASDGSDTKQCLPVEPEHPAPIPGKSTGHFTMVAQHLFRHWMPVLSDRAWKALCIVIDHSWGYQQQQAFISLSTFKRELGLPPGQDEPVYRVLRELLFFRVLAVSNERGKRGIKAYFITESALTTHTTLVVQEGKLCVTTHEGLVELLTLREMFSSPYVKDSPHRELGIKLYPIADQAGREGSPHDSKHEAKYIAKETGKDKINTPSVQPGSRSTERGREHQKVKREPPREDAPLPSATLTQTQPATVTVTSNVEEEELEDIWGRPHFPGEDDLKELLDGLRRSAKHVSGPGVPEKVYAKIQAVQAEYVQKKNASIQAYQHMQAAYQTAIYEQITSAPAEPEVRELWNGPEQAPEQGKEVGEEDSTLNPTDLLATVTRLERQLAEQVQEIAVLRVASAEAKRRHGFGSLEWSEAESRRRQAIRLQHHLEDELKAKIDQCNQTDDPFSAEAETVPLEEQIAAVPPRKQGMKAAPFDCATQMKQVRHQAATSATTPARPSG